MRRLHKLLSICSVDMYRKLPGQLIFKLIQNKYEKKEKTISPITLEIK